MRKTFFCQSVSLGSTSTSILLLLTTIYEVRIQNLSNACDFFFFFWGSDANYVLNGITNLNTYTYFQI